MKFVTKSIFFLSVLTIFAAVSFAQTQDTGGAKGRVCNASYRSLAQVKITVLQNGNEIKSTVTNKKGEFSFEGLKTGTYDFIFKKDGFNSGTMKNVELGKKEMRNLGQSLVLDVDDGSLVIIKGYVFDEEGRSIPFAQVLIEKILGENNFQKIKTAYSSNGGDVVDRGEFTFKLPEGKAKYRITATFKDRSASKEMSVESAAVYRTAISINLKAQK